MVIIGITGSIACYKSCYIVNALVKDNYKVTVVMTSSAKKFISPLTFQSLTGNPVIHNMFQNGVSLYNIPHINLAKEAEVIAVVPATANLIGRLASGICDDILTCLIISSKCPKLIAPAMNENMFMNEIVKDNIKKLEDKGFDIIYPVKGHLACGYEGMGHLASEEIILKEIRSYIKSGE